MKVIRMSDAIHEQLKREAKAEGRTLQWVVENKLTANTPLPKNTEAPKPAERIALAAPKIDNLFKLPDANDILLANREQECCLNELAPCRHWTWDTQTGDGYKNSLSGRVMEVTG